MKTLVISMSMILCFSCATFEEEFALGEHKVTYKVSTTSGRWLGQYINKYGETICLHEEPFQHGDWLYSFVTNTLPDELSINATSELFSDSTLVNKPDVTASLYIDGELVDMQTNSIADGKTEASNLALPL